MPITVIQAVEQIKNRFQASGGRAEIPLRRDGHFWAELTDDGISVDNLGTQPDLPWVVFQEAIGVLLRNGGTALAGNALMGKLGSQRMPLDSVEGHVAHVVYGKQIGQWAFRRIAPIAAILIWSGLCKAERGKLILRDADD